MLSSDAFVPTFLQGPPLARDVVAYASAWHHAGFLVHPLEVASLLYNAGYDDSVVTAGVLHDTLEDTTADLSDIRARFGDAVAELVNALTEDPAIEDFAERKAALRRQVARFGAHATAVYAADKVTKVRELRARAAHDRAALAGRAGRERLDHYRQSLEMLELRAADHPLVRQLRFELEALAAMPSEAG